MYLAGLRCRSCGRPTPKAMVYSCASCGGILEAAYDYESVRAAHGLRDALGASGDGTMWRFRCLLPVTQAESIVSLGEGGTPLLAAPRMAARLGAPGLLFKDEGANPTGSFKDRPTSVAISVAKELGAEKIIIASSGNAGAAMAAYSARAGLPAVVVVPVGTPSGKVHQALCCGARVVYTHGSYSNAFALCREAARRLGWANVSSTFLNPYTVEGDKTVAYEIFEQLGGKVPDWVVVPIGDGPLLVGILKGFEELRMMGLADRVPAMVGVQSAAVQPIAEAFRSGSPTVEEWHRATKTIASGIADPLVGYPQDGTLTLASIRSSRGLCLSVSDETAIAAGRTLAESEGIFVEPTSATGVAAVAELVAQGAVRASDTVVVLLTGHGLKTPDAYLDSVPEPPVVDSVEMLIELA